MDNNTLYHIISLIISSSAFIGVIISWLSWRDQKSEKTSDLEQSISMLKAAKLTERVSALETKIAILEERIGNTIHLMERLDRTLDQINDELDDRD